MTKNAKSEIRQLIFFVFCVVFLFGKPQFQNVFEEDYIQLTPNPNHATEQKKKVSCLVLHT